MKKLMYLLIFLCLPVIISAQEMTNIRNQIDNSKSRDSIMKELLPVAEKWRMNYNSKSENQLSSFYAENSEYITSNLNGYHGNSDLIAIFQKRNETGGAIDSVLILSVNSSCDKTILFVKQLERVNKKNVADRNIITWKKANGLWTIVTLQKQ